MVTNLISGITGQFTRQWILGHFIPAVLFVIIGRALLVPMFPPDLSLLEPLESLGTEWQIVVIAFATILLTGLLFNLNNTISRLYQGYGWNDLWFGKLRVERYRKRFDVAHAQRRAMRTLRDDLRRSDGKEETIAWLDQRRSAIARRLDREYPARSQILPTRLGNVIRSNEYYPIRQYGMDGEALWPRMIGAMNKDYGAAVVDAKTSFDFTLNTSLLSGIMALSIFLLGLYYRFSLASLDLALRHSAEIVFFAGMSYVMYLMTIARAKEWGDMYRGAFDLYRGDLLKCLGYEQAPGTVTEEKRLWEPISRQLNFGYPPLIGANQ